MPCAMCHVPCSVCCVLCAVCCVLCAVCCVLCAVCCVLCAVCRVVRGACCVPGLGDRAREGEAERGTLAATLAQLASDWPDLAADLGIPVPPEALGYSVASRTVLFRPDCM